MRRGWVDDLIREVAYDGLKSALLELQNPFDGPQVLPLGDERIDTPVPSKDRLDQATSELCAPVKLRAVWCARE